MIWQLFGGCVVMALLAVALGNLWDRMFGKGWEER